MMPVPPTYSVFDERCQDVTLDISPGGDLDLAYRQIPATPPFATQIFLARRSQGAGAELTHALVFDAISGIDQVSQGLPDFGCRSALAYDDGDQPFVMTLVRGMRGPFADPATSTIPNENISFVRGGGCAGHGIHRRGAVDARGGLRHHRGRRIDRGAVPPVGPMGLRH